MGTATAENKIDREWLIDSLRNILAWSVIASGYGHLVLPPESVLTGYKPMGIPVGRWAGNNTAVFSQTALRRALKTAPKRAPLYEPSVGQMKIKTIFEK